MKQMSAVISNYVDFNNETNPYQIVLFNTELKVKCLKNTVYETHIIQILTNDNQ